MRKDYYETKEYVVTEQLLVKREIICDICKQEIQHGAGYWMGATYTNDWGNDSYAHFDVCSIECLKSKFDEYCGDSNSNDNTWQIKVEHTVA